jgi:hypothetical protein
MNLIQWIDAVTKVLAVLIGACWVLFNYYRGRTHKDRLRLSVSAERAFFGGLEYLIIKTELTNVGLSKVDVALGCHLTIYVHLLPKKMESITEPRWNELRTIDLFGGQSWIEPNGLMMDQQLVAVPGVANRFLRVWAHFEAPEVGLNAYFVARPNPAQRETAGAPQIS